jgi:hypothetical protein
MQKAASALSEAKVRLRISTSACAQTGTDSSARDGHLNPTSSLPSRHVWRPVLRRQRCSGPVVHPGMAHAAKQEQEGRQAGKDECALLSQLVPGLSGLTRQPTLPLLQPTLSDRSSSSSTGSSPRPVCGSERRRTATMPWRRVSTSPRSGCTTSTSSQ